MCAFDLNVIFFLCKSEVSVLFTFFICSLFHFDKKKEKNDDRDFGIALTL